jgi:hypothetical protein
MFKAAERQLGPGGLGALVLACSAAGVLVVTHPARADANELTVFSCHDPAGEAIGHDGWVNQRTSDLDMVAGDSCGGAGSGALRLELLANFGGYGNGARTEWVFQAPAWASIASYTLDLTGSYAIPSTGGGSGQAFVIASDESDPSYDYRNLGAGEQGAGVLSRTPPAPVQWLALDASCDGQDGPCPANARISALGLTAARILLRDPTTPSVGSLSGNLLPGSTVRGTGEADFTAADSGPGVYSAQLSIDGSPQAPVLLDSNGGWCRDLGQSGDGTRSFAHPDPCMQSVSGGVSLDTTSLADGEHTVRLTVDDASGNVSTAFNGTLTTHNAPALSSPPTITGNTPAGGQKTFTASTGSWSAPAGAGPISYGYRWQDCDVHGGECQDIPGGSAASYSPNSADGADTLRVLVTASDHDGLATASSAPTEVIAGPASGGQVGTPASALPGVANGSGASGSATVRLSGPQAFARTYPHSAFTLSGSLNGLGGAPIGGATLDVMEQVPGAAPRVVGQVQSTAAGSFQARLDNAPSRTVQIGYRAYSNDPHYAASGQVKESVSATVALRVSPPHTSATGAIVLRGRVSGPVPRGGVIVELLVHYRGAWEPFRTPRTDARGRFSARYQFQGAVGRFPFRAEVPNGQAGYPYTAGTSPTVIVRSG